MKIINPATEAFIKEVQEDNSSSVQLAYDQLKEGQLIWATKSINDRIACIEKFKELLLTNINHLSQVLTSEVGKPLNQASGEIKGACGRIQYFIEHSEEVLKERIAHKEEGLEEKVTFEPLGVIANISAWNYPYLVGVNVFIPALIAGNSVLYKPSEFSTLTGLEIEKLILQAGIPSNVFKCLLGEGEVGQLLLDLPLEGYFFTGSYKTGQFIYNQVASKMVPCQMELGGKDPMYVSSSVSDIVEIAKGAAEGVFYNNGQSCCAVERIYVHTDIYDVFVAAFVEEVRSFRMGDPIVDGTFLGPLTRNNQREVLSNQVEQAIKLGAKLELGGLIKEGKGYYFEPTVLTHVNHAMLVMTEESFGPIIGIQKVENNIEAIQLMKDTEYGLTSSIFTADKEEFEWMGSQMNSGTVYWNCCDRVSANTPWSGRKHSGFGSTLSEEGVKAFVQSKAWHLRI